MENMENRINKLLEDKIEDIFIAMQDELQIDSGDITPMQSLELLHATTNLASVIADILKEQEKGGIAYYD